MPVNSFEHYPMAWRPDKQLLGTPLYLKLAKRLEQDIQDGTLPAGTQLPPQRELADFLDINLSTVTRAFKLCQQKGLIYAIIGKGTFVSFPQSLPLMSLKKDETLISLGKSYCDCQADPILSESFSQALQHSSEIWFSQPDRTQQEERHKTIAKQWLQKFQVQTSTQNILLTSGTQNALLIILLSLFKAGDKIATDTFTYTNFITLAHQMQLELIPILSDNQGIIPRDLEKKIRQQGIKGLYLVPTVNNPTATSIPLQRRKAISSIIKQYSLLLIEDDAYAFTNSRRLPPFVSLIPEQTLYIHSLSKSLSPYLRTAYLVAPQGLIAELNTTSQTINAPISALNLQFTDYLLTSGKAQAVIRQKKKLIVERNTLYQHFFPNFTSDNPLSLLQWLPLPPGWDGYAFEKLAQNHNLEILCAERFLAGGRLNQSAVRLAVLSPKTKQELKRGLIILKKLISLVDNKHTKPQ